MIPVWIFWIIAGIGLLQAVGKVKLIPMSKNVAWILVIVGGLGSFGVFDTLLAGLETTTITGATVTDDLGMPCLNTLQIDASAGSTGMSYNSLVKVFTQATAVNTTSSALTNVPTNATFTLVRSDTCINEYASFIVEGTSVSFTNVTSGLTYNVVPKDSYGKLQISLTVDNGTVYNTRTISFTPGQTKTLQVHWNTDYTALTNMYVNDISSIPISIGGQSYNINILRTSDVT